MGRAVLFVKRRIKRGRHITIPTGRRKIKAKSLFPRRRINIVKGRRSVYKIRKPMPRPFRRIPMPWLQATRTISRFGGLIGSFGTQYTRMKKKSWSPSKSVSTRRNKSSFGGARRKPSTWSKKRAPKKAVEEVFGLGWSYYKWHMKPKTMEPHWFHPKKKVFKVPERRGGKRDLSKVVYPDYGPFPKHIDPYLIFRIRPTDKFRTALIMRKIGFTDMTNIANITKILLDEVRSKLLTYAKIIIGKYVPRDTGDLQKAMYKSLEDCKRDKYSLKIEMEAPIDYAGVVNRMPEHKLRHHTSMGKRSRKTRKLLHDPLAQKTSFNYIKLQLKDKARSLIYDMVTKMVVLWSRGLSPQIQPPIGRPQIPIAQGIPSSGDFETDTEYLGVSRIGYDVMPAKRIDDIRRADPMMEDRRRYSRHAEMWKNAQMKPTPKIAIPYDRNLIKGFFKIDGLYKKRKG